MKKYQNPAIRIIHVEQQTRLLTGSLSMGISDEPPTGPALSKDAPLYNEDDEAEDASEIWGIDK